jgi:SNF family Na+-dependent transporter
MSQAKQEWGTRLGVILAVAGSAVGLGNFLRFPGNAAENGGGAFMIPYFCALLFLGIPIGWAEWAMGRYGGRKGFHSAPAIMGVVARGAAGRFLGVIGVLIPLAVYFYYTMIEAWCLAYCWDYVAHGGIGLDETRGVQDQVAVSTAHFEGFTGQAADGSGFNGELIVFWAIVTAFNVWFVYRGLSGGIEKFCRWAMPAMAVCGLLVLLRVLTLGTPDPEFPDRSVNHGLGFMWNPDYTKLGDFKTWLAAAGQIFFSLSVGFGVIINYSSYLKKKDDVVLSGLTASATNEFFEVALGGLITITAAVAFLGIAVTSTSTGSSFDLGFKTLPVVFAHMPFGRFFGAIWFFMLFLAAITSSLSMMQPAQAFLAEALGLTRGAATTIVTGVCVAGNLFVLYFSKGLQALDTIDFWVGSFFVFVMAMVQIICFSWVFGLDRGLREAHHGAQLRIPGVFRFIMKWVAPVYLLVIFVGFCWQTLPDKTRPDGTVKAGYLSTLAEDRVAQLTWGLLLAVIVALVVVTAIGARRWRAQGLDLDGTQDAEA